MAWLVTLTWSLGGGCTVGAAHPSRLLNLRGAGGAPVFGSSCRLDACAWSQGRAGQGGPGAEHGQGKCDSRSTDGCAAHRSLPAHRTQTFARPLHTEGARTRALSSRVSQLRRCTSRRCKCPPIGRGLRAAHHGVKEPGQRTCVAAAAGQAAGLIFLAGVRRAPCVARYIYPTQRAMAPMAGICI